MLYQPDAVVPPNPRNPAIPLVQLSYYLGPHQYNTPTTNPPTHTSSRPSLSHHLTLAQTPTCPLALLQSPTPPFKTPMFRIKILYITMLSFVIFTSFCHRSWYEIKLLNPPSSTSFLFGGGSRFQLKHLQAKLKK